MKKKFSLSIILFLFIASACSVNIEKNEDPNFVPASLKNQPRIVYPADAQKKAFSGLTSLILSISDEGTVVKIFLDRSSGYNVLDNAAVEYCRKLLFTPATLNDKPIFSRLKWDIKFSISSGDWTASRYVNEINELYESYLISDGEERKEIERKILQKHTGFIAGMTDALSFNSVSRKVILPQISGEWQRDWNSWPLTFLIYHDFMVRFPDFDSPADVKAQLLKSLREDLLYIRKTGMSSGGEAEQKETVMGKIRSFMRDHYPDLILDNFGFDGRDYPGQITFRQESESTLNN